MEIMITLTGEGASATTTAEDGRVDTKSFADGYETVAVDDAMVLAITGPAMVRAVCEDGESLEIAEI